MTLPVSDLPVGAAVLAVGFGLIPTGGTGEPSRWLGDVVGVDVEGLALAVALDGLAAGVRLGVSEGSAGTGEMADWVAGCAAEDDAAAAADAPAAADAAADAWTAAELEPADVAEPAADVAAELTAAEVAGVSAGLVELLQAASAEKTVIAMTTCVRRAVRVRRAIPHAATPPNVPESASSTFRGC